MLRAVLLTSLLVILLSGSSAVRAPLVLSATELAGLSARAQGDPVVARWKSSLLAEADRMLAATPEIPAEGGGWYHDYFCPTHARQLVYVGPGRHRCPVDGEILSGPLYDAARRYFVHADNARRVRQLGLAYALSGRIDYASGARQYLLALAERYPDWPLRGRRPGRAPLDGARMFAQTLDEAIQGLALLQGYDLTRDSSVYSSRDRERVETRLFHEMMRTINRPAPGPSNWHTWHNAYLLSAGYALDDATLVRRILDGPWGVREQLQRSVDGDGFWYEGAISLSFLRPDRAGRKRRSRLASRREPLGGPEVGRHVFRAAGAGVAGRALSRPQRLASRIDLRLCRPLSRGLRPHAPRGVSLSLLPRAGGRLLRRRLSCNRPASARGAAPVQESEPARRGTLAPAQSAHPAGRRHPQVRSARRQPRPF
ncbi:alginate lyase family protein [bacterium]|nr:alginate lyase family protein [bacterium]